MGQNEQGAARHTPGPWAARRCGAPSRLMQVYAGSAPSYPVAQVIGDGGRAEGIESRRVDANAALIAAAPELLEACRAWEAYMTTHLVVGKNGKANSEVAALIESTRAAIAKARQGGGA